MVKKIQAIYNELRSQILERDELLRGCMLALLARKHLFVLGPPGTAKSLGTEKICKAVKGATYFEWLMDKFTKPEDLFGPYKLSKLKDDEYERNVTGALPTADIAFLDEIWKASGAILNTLLRLMDESRRFYNNFQSHQSPLISLFCASNELPEENGLGALYDRMLLRFYVDYISDDSNFQQLLNLVGVKIKASITLEELNQAQEEVTKVGFKSIVPSLVKLRINLKQEGLTFSDRRWRESIRLLQASAWMNGRDEVIAEDLEVLADVLWEKPSQRRQVWGQISTLISPQLAKALEHLDAAQEVFDSVMKDKNTEDAVQATRKFRQLMEEELTGDDPRVEEVRDKVESMQKTIFRQILGLNV